MSDPAANGTPPQPPEGTILPGPVPTSMVVAQGPPLTGTDPSVLLIVSTPTGTAVYFMDPPMAMTIGAAVAKAGRSAATGLVLP